MSYELEVSVGSNSTSVSTPLKELEQKPLKTKKQDALDLAEVIYDIFKDSVSSATIGDINMEGAKNA